MSVSSCCVIASDEGINGASSPDFRAAASRFASFLSIRRQRSDAVDGFMPISFSISANVHLRRRIRSNSRHASSSNSPLAASRIASSIWFSLGDGLYSHVFSAQSLTGSIGCRAYSSISSLMARLMDLARYPWTFSVFFKPSTPLASPTHPAENKSPPSVSPNRPLRYRPSMALTLRATRPRWATINFSRAVVSPANHSLPRASLSSGVGTGSVSGMSCSMYVVFMVSVSRRQFVSLSIEAPFSPVFRARFPL